LCAVGITPNYYKKSSFLPGIYDIAGLTLILVLILLIGASENVGRAPASFLATGTSILSGSKLWTTGALFYPEAHSSNVWAG
jgi:hypothetical protein